ncbi:glycosyltransferase group 2 family protein [Eubacterium sp. CAG:786]|nr:glycosyltransferase group 2 family protein [Eubacterium sp. CAG:786]
MMEREKSAMLSVIIPSYNENENIRRTAQTIAGILSDAAIEYELIFVDDGSRDTTWAEICAAHDSDPCVRGLGFSRNFGKEGAIFAGLKNARGDCAVVIDCDLQHPPELIPQMYQLWQGGAEVVEAIKRSRGKEGLFHKIFARSFYKMMKSSSGINLDGASDFKLLDRKVINALNELPERITFFRALSSWVGFTTERVEFDVQPRAAGKSKFSMKSLFRFALNNITSFTDVPIRLITWVGVIFGIMALVLGIQTLVKYFCGQAAEGFSTVILLILITGACVLLGVGVIGYYLSKIYEEIKQRPRYIVARTTGGKERADGK